MANPQTWVPVRWPGGPLEAALVKTHATSAQTLSERWQQPDSLKLLKTTPFNCIVVWWAAGLPQDADQQRALAPLLERARAEGIAVVGRIRGDAKAERNAKYLDGIIADKAPFDGASVAAVKIDELNTIPTAPALAINDASWPEVPMKAQGGSGGDHGGPTGNPWIDSNGWAIQLLAAKAPGRIIWVLTEPPDRVLRTEAYLLAISDAAANGARWPVMLERQLGADLLDGKPEALQSWKRIADAVRRFEDSRVPACNPVANLGVCSDFSGENAFLADEVLNLATRRLLPYRVLLKNGLTAQELDGLKAVLWVNEKAPEGGAKSVLDTFLHKGGTLIVPASAAHMTDGLPPAGRHDQGYAIYKLGQGRIAVARQPWNDPFLLAEDAHLVMGRKYDVIRMWNAGTSTVRFTESNGRGIAQIVNFAGRRAAHDASLYVARPYRTAQYTSLDAQPPRQLEVKPREGGIEINLPPLSVYGRIEFGG